MNFRNRSASFFILMMMIVLSYGCSKERSSTLVTGTSTPPPFETPTHTYAYQQTAMAKMKENLNADLYTGYYLEATPASEVADFLIIVYPPPGAMLVNDLEVDRITVIFWGDDIDQGCATVGEEMYERFKMFVDGSLIARDQLMFTSMLEIGTFVELSGEAKCTFDNGPFSIFAYPNLDEGRHWAKFQITRNTGEMLEYEWEFELRAQLKK